MERLGEPWQTQGPLRSFGTAQRPRSFGATRAKECRWAPGGLRARNGAFCNRWQETWRDGPSRIMWRHQGWNAKPQPTPGVRITWLDAALNFQNRLEVVAFGDDGALWHA